MIGKGPKDEPALQAVFPDAGARHRTPSDRADREEFLPSRAHTAVGPDRSANRATRRGPFSYLRPDA
jgi:hypothetical protein